MSDLVVIPCSRGPMQRAVDAVQSGAAAIGQRFAPGLDRVARLPSWSWPLIAAAAGWPALAWSLRRFGDGSDDPFGIVAWIALAVAWCIARRRFDHPPRTGLLMASAAVSMGCALPVVAMPDLLRALLTAIAIVLAMAAIVDDDEPFLPYAGFALLALPLLSSLQFYAGYPLRVVTAEASRWLLIALGSAVARDGSALTVDGQLVLVDAPCSGVKMAWVGYFTACSSAWLFRTSSVALSRRLPIVGLLILGGNVVRNTILVALEAGGPVSQDTHERIGLATFALVCMAIVALFARCKDRVRAVQRVRVEPVGRSRLSLSRDMHRRGGAVACVFVIAALVPLVATRARSAPVAGSVEWPTALDGIPLTPVALSAVEQRFAADFPGAIGRFANGPDVVVLRAVDQPTRRLHPATDCYRALGYTIVAERLERRRDEQLWRCFDARRGRAGLRVCERIVDIDGQAYTDVSSWYWSAVLGRSQGPWRATTVARPITGAST